MPSPENSGPPGDETKASSPMSAENLNSLGATVELILPIATDTQPVTDPARTEVSHTLADDPTLSHALATDDREVKGTAQQGHVDDVLDLGWNQDKQDIVAPLVGGLDNEDLWLLIRRFNKQVYHVKAIPSPVPGGLDLNIADEEEFSPDKLRATIERLYMTVVIGLLATVKHVARLRSWRESKRTACFAGAYFTAWAVDLLMPLLSLTIITLIAYPPSRGLLFPPAPLALISSGSGGVQKPKAGVLGSHDSATGAPENHRGEAVEQEASNFVNGMASIALSSATGKHPDNGPGDDEDDGDAVPDPTAISTGAADARAAVSGGKPGAKHDKTKLPMETAMWTKMRPVMHALTDVADSWERFANALSPTRPFPQQAYRLRLAILIVPMFCGSLFLTSYMVMKGITFAIGSGFFGEPVIARGTAFLNRKYPHWQKLLELRNSILKGAPTNAQLTITLLRIGEANKAPLPPPPPRTTEAPPDQPAAITDAHLRSAGAEPPLNATAAELHDAIQPGPDPDPDPPAAAAPHATADGADTDAARPPTSRHGRLGHRVMALLRGTAKGAVRTAQGTDAARARTGSSKAKDRLGVVLPPAGGGAQDRGSGPVAFRARHRGKRGHVVITTTTTTAAAAGRGAAVAFSTSDAIATATTSGTHERERGGEALRASWRVAVADIAELKKIGGYGWKARLVVGWALGREVADGLEMVTRSGEVLRVTALPLRDELFNRLVAMGGQKWEAW